METSRNLNKLVFLDIDGVLNDEYQPMVDAYVNGQYHGFYSPVFVDRLNEITSKTGAEIVVSSTWRLGLSIDDLKSLCHNMGIQCKVVGATPSMFKCKRGDEIEQYIKHNPVDKYVILDDDTDMKFSQKLFHFVYINGYLGLQQPNVKRAIKILGEL